MGERERPLGQTVLGVHSSAPAPCFATSGRPLPPLGLSCIVSKDLSATLAPPSSRIPIDGVTTAYSDAGVPLSSTTCHTHSHALTRTHQAPVEQKPLHISFIKQQTPRDGKLALSFSPFVR